jgi:hypothetical protein
MSWIVVGGRQGKEQKQEAEQTAAAAGEERPLRHSKWAWGRAVGQVAAGVASARPRARPPPCTVATDGPVSRGPHPPRSVRSRRAPSPPQRPRHDSDSGVG